MKQLREYQDSDKQAIEEALLEFGSVLYQLPTGGGKSVVITSIVNDYKTEQILIFAHKRKLLFQLKKHLKSIGITAGILSGDIQENLDSNIIIASIRTAVNDSRLQFLLDRDLKKVIIDEARHSRTPSYDKVLDAIKVSHPVCEFIGVDATPYRNDKKRLDKHFQHMVVSSENIATLMEKGFLQKCKAIVSPIDKESLLEQVKSTDNDYQITSLSNYMRQEKYLDYVINQYLTYGEGRPAIVFAVDKAHSRDLKSKFESNGFLGKVERIDSDMSETEVQNAFGRFERGESTVLINVEMVTEGVDLPNAGCIIGARPTKSLTLYMQMVGRGMRLDDMFDYFILLDCCGWTADYGTISTPKTWSLNPEIDPNSGRIGNKIFGRRPDGTLTEDLTNFIGEVIEMTPEEYMEQLLGSEEQAIIVNKNIDDKINDIYVKILSLILKPENYKDFEYKIENKYGDVQYIFTLINDSEVSSYYKQNVTIEISTSGTKFIFSKCDKSFSNEYKTSYMKCQVLNGFINKEMLSKPNFEKQAFELLEQVTDLQKSKIDLSNFKKAKEKLAKQEREQMIEEVVKTTGIFELKNELYYTDYFRTEEYPDPRITKIELTSNKLLSENTIKFHCYKSDYKWEDGNRKLVQVEIVIEKKFVLKAKFYQLLEDGMWNKN
jgi:superfamily II DNA or RNA helicase